MSSLYYINKILHEVNRTWIKITSFLDERIAHQNSQADALNSSFDEYKTDKPKDKNIRICHMTSNDKLDILT